MSDDAPVLAPLYDGFDPASGPYFDSSRPRIADPAERDRLLGFLGDGTLALRSTRFDPDVVEPARGQVVPGSFRTDGQWLWSEAVEYYVREHAIAPAAGFYEHIVSREFRCARPGPADLRRCVERLTHG